MISQNTPPQPDIVVDITPDALESDNSSETSLSISMKEKIKSLGKHCHELQEIIRVQKLELKALRKFVQDQNIFDKEVDRLMTVNSLIDDDFLKYQSQMGKEEEDELESIIRRINTRIFSPLLRVSDIRDILPPSLLIKLPSLINCTYNKLVEEEDRKVLRLYHRNLSTYIEIYACDSLAERQLVPYLAIYLLKLFYKLLINVESPRSDKFFGIGQKDVTTFASQMYRSPHEITGEKPPLPSTMSKVYNEQQYGDHVKSQQKRLALKDAAAKERRRKEAEESLAFFAG